MTQQITGGKFSATYPDIISGALKPASGYKLHTYVSGTTTNLTTWSDVGLTAPNLNPITLNTRGEASVFLGTSAYTLVLKSATGTTIWTQDGVVSPDVATAAVNTSLAAFIAQLATSAGAGLIGWIRSGAGAVTTTIQKWMDWQTPTVFDYMTAAEIADVQSGALTRDVSAAIQTALNANKEVICPVGSYLIGSKITVPAHTKLILSGGLGNTLGSYPATLLVKKSTMVTSALDISSTGWVEGGGMFCQPGNFGDGIVLLGNNAKLSNFLVHGAGNDGVRVGVDVAANTNSFELHHVTSQYSGRHGIYVHHGVAAVGPDANRGTLHHCFTQFNGGDGIRLGHCWWNMLSNCLSATNTGWGLYISPTLNGGVAESRYHTIVGGDYNEGNVGGTASVSGYACSVYQPDPNQLLIVDGVFCNHFGNGRGTSIQGLNIDIYPLNVNCGQIAFPAVAVPSADPNSLDDYEEIDFLPTIRGSTTVGAATYSVQKGRATKVGRLVNFEIYVTWTAGTGVGILRVGNLPYAPNAAAANFPAVTVGQIAGLTLNANSIVTALIDAANGYISVQQYAVGVGTSSNVAYSAAGTLILSGSYTV